MGLGLLIGDSLMEAETCRARGINDVAFMDPNKVNKRTCKGIDGNPHDVMKHVTQIFLNCELVRSILLAYHCEYVILAFLNTII